MGEGIHEIKRRDWAHGKYIIIRVPDPDGDVFQRVVDVVNNSAPQNITRPDDTELVFPGLRISPYTGMVVYDGQQIRLNTSEFRILCHLARHPGRIFSKEQLYYAIYGEEGYDTNAIPTAIWRLQSKLEKDPRKPVLRVCSAPPIPQKHKQFRRKYGRISARE